jgi:hypothetical protein
MFKINVTREELEFLVEALKRDRDESITVLPAREQLYERLFDTLYFDQPRREK